MEVKAIGNSRLFIDISDYFSSDLFRCNGPFSKWQGVVAGAGASPSGADMEQASSSEYETDEELFVEHGTIPSLNGAPGLRNGVGTEAGGTDSAEEAQSDLPSISPPSVPTNATLSAPVALGEPPGAPLSSSPLSQPHTRATIFYTARPFTAGMGSKAWPLPPGRSRDVNFNKRTLGFADLDKEPPPAKRRGRWERSEPDRPSDEQLDVLDDVLPPGTSAWAEPVGALFPALVGACEESRFKDPLPLGLRRIVDLNKSLDTVARVVSWFEDGSPLPSADRVYLRDMFLERALREMKGLETPTFLDSVRVMFDPKDINTHRPVSVSSPCCSFSHQNIKLPSVIEVTAAAVDRLGSEAPLFKDVLLATIPWSTPGFRRKKCTREQPSEESDEDTDNTAQEPCFGPPMVSFANKGLNRVVVTATFVPGSWTVWTCRPSLRSKRRIPLPAIVFSLSFTVTRTRGNQLPLLRE